MFAWTVLSLLFLLSLVIIGLRRWEGWIFAVITSVGWIVYSLVGGVRVVELVVHVLLLLVSVLFLVRWNRAQRTQDEEEIDEQPTAATIK
ncbi:MAG TPA: hypothetical protein VE617_07895 [Propionibacteriaceae bacterium]|jgi:uncharacterized membrane protein|nr:hypothetical protein [Propionibacteriaceae bacterium]